MSYYNVLGLCKEPFSTSPDPYFFFHSSNHITGLARLEISVRLRRGLCLVLGDVGTGKTTLSRAFLNAFRDESDFIFHMILDPNYTSEAQFLFTLAKMFNIVPASRSTLALKEALQKYLYQKGVIENKTIVLLIDEAQKISRACLEVLRTLLNYETNEYKLLQLVMLAQTELLPRIRHIDNFMDRIALKYTIHPLDEAQTRSLIEFRLIQAGFTHYNRLFADSALHLIYTYTQGYPRKIAMLCHDALEIAVINEHLVIDEGIIKEVIRRRQFDEL